MTTEHAPSPLATPLAWDLVAPGYARESVEFFEHYAGQALDLAQLTGTEDVLDVAAGPGSLTLLAARRAGRVDALDFSPAMLAALSARAAEAKIANVVVHTGDGQALPFADATFDAAFSMFGLIFFPDRARGFRELRRVLRPGGRAVVSSWMPLDQVPLLNAVFDALRAELPALPFGDGKGPLTDPDTFRAEMSAAGFAVELHDTRHAIEAPTLAEFWGGLRRTLAPLVLLEHKLGHAAFAPVAEGIERRLHAQFDPGPCRVEMPAWLGLGRV